MKDCTISYVDLLHPNPYPPRVEEDPVLRASKRLAIRKSKRVRTFG